MHTLQVQRSKTTIDEDTAGGSHGSVGVEHTARLAVPDAANQAAEDASADEAPPVVRLGSSADGATRSAGPAAAAEDDVVAAAERSREGHKARNAQCRAQRKGGAQQAASAEDAGEAADSKAEAPSQPGGAEAIETAAAGDEPGSASAAASGTAEVDGLPDAAGVWGSAERGSRVGGGAAEAEGTSSDSSSSDVNQQRMPDRDAADADLLQ